MHQDITPHASVRLLRHRPILLHYQKGFPFTKRPIPWRESYSLAVRWDHFALTVGEGVLYSPAGTWLFLGSFGPRSFVASMIADKMISRTVAPDRAVLVETVTAALRRCDKRGLLMAARSAMFERGDTVPLLAEVRVPTVFCTGAEDSLFPVEEARRQASMIPRCRFVVVEKSSHQSALESPARVLSVVREALTEWHRPDRQKRGDAEQTVRV